MARYVTKTIVFHNNVEFPVKSVIELTPEEAKPLLEANAIEPTKEEIPAGQEEKPVEKFSAPTSTPEVEKAVNSASLAPNKRGKCPKCKVEREIRNPQVSQSPKGTIHLIGECAICGTRISRIAGRVKLIKE